LEEAEQRKVKTVQGVKRERERERKRIKKKSERMEPQHLLSPRADGLPNDQ
jgi:hypothetical protein